MPLDRIITDPIISTENAAFSPHSPSADQLPPPSTAALPSDDERVPLVGAPRPSKPFYRARPLWLVPFALIASLTRGMTLASRVEVFTQLSCQQLYDNLNHTSFPHVPGSLTSVLDPAPSFTPISLPHPVYSFQDSRDDGVDETDDPRVLPGGNCVSDPAVQAGAARLQTIMTTTMGVLSALTTGWWLRFSERHGRTRALAISTLGLFLTDLVFILVSTPHNLLSSHSHKLLILAPIVEGLSGGWSSLSSAKTAYIADCTSPGSRATIFARFTGVLSVGLALGPIIGAWLIRNPIPFLNVGPVDHPLQSVNSVFWVAISGSFVNLLLVLFVFPESLSASRRAMNRKGKNRAIEGYEIEATTPDKPTWIVVRVVKSFVSPLAVFLPADVPVARVSGTHNNNNPRVRRDWSLSFLGLSFFIYGLASGVFQIKYLYAEHVYGWAAEQLSYYISFLGAIRAFHLLVFLPFLLATFKPARAALSAQPNSNGLIPKPKPTRGHLFSEIRFDLVVVRCSMFIEFFSHALVAISPLPLDDPASAWWSQFMFVGATSLACTGAGVMPAVQSMALCTLQGRKVAVRDETARLQGDADSAEHDTAPELGKLFGALAIVQAVGSTILGPIVFGVIYSSTVASLPRAIFVAAAALVIVSLVLTILIRPDVSLSIPKNKQKKAKTGTGPRYRPEEIRGRSRASKDLRGGSASGSYGATRYDTSVSTGRTETGTSGLV